MGQGYSMTTLSAASATIDVPELSDLVYDKTLASARFMKSLRARSQQGYVFVKAIMKPYSAFSVREYVRQITEERNTLAAIPNTLGYQRIVEVSTGGFLLRQYISSSVYDRLSTRPFLEDIEKRWLSYQLLCAIRDCHAQNLYHGDIKTENLLVTSWNWLYLTDFSAAFKPTTLPEDNPADFSFYFDTSSRRVCYIAPERFTSQNTDDAPDELNWAMDMFSVGCAIAEMFLEGPIFTLSQIFKYRTGEYNPDHAQISKIEDQEVRAMILNMIELDPEKRYSAEQHLSFYKTKIFPEYFYSFLHDYMLDLTEPAAVDGQVALDAEILLESDKKIDRVYHDFDKISYFLGYSGDTQPVDKGHDISFATQGRLIRTQSHIQIDNALHDGTLLFLTLVSAAIRNTAKSSARLTACDLLTSFASRLPDEAKLDRILPYVVGLLNDKSDMVKVAALHATTSILDSIRVVSPINAYLFPEYIFPKLRTFLPIGQSQPSPLVRTAYASCLATLALASERMLDMVQAIRADGRLPALSSDTWAPDASPHSLYDVARAELIPHFEESTTILITDEDTSVRRALLGSISRLCLFFGSGKASDVILSHLNTYLNEPDWMLRCAFYNALVGVATYVGTSSLEQYILPIMVGSITDGEHFVVEKVIRSLARMAALGLFQKSMIWDLSNIVVRFLVHPSVWIREAAAQFVEQACKFLSPADRYCIMLPILQPFLRSPLLKFTEEALLDRLKPSLSRPVFEAAVQWAAKKEKSLFWTAASRDGIFTGSQFDSSLAHSTFGKRFPHRIPPSQKDKNDQQSLETLRNFGMLPDDEVKLMALREYILRYSQNKPDAGIDDRQQMLNNLVSLAQLDVTPQNVFFDTVHPYRTAKRQRSRPSSIKRDTSRSIADALLDASINLDGTDTPTRTSTGDLRVDSTMGKATPINIRADKKSSGDNTPTSLPQSSFDRPNIRIEGLKGESARRSSSISGRHALLDANRLSVPRRDSKKLEHRNNSFTSASRAETMKADAELSTNQENAFGKIDRSPTEQDSGQESALTMNLASMKNVRSKSPASQDHEKGNVEANHSYHGNDPAVIRLLDNHLADNFSIDLLDFGATKKSAEIEYSAIKSATTSHQPTNQAIAQIGSASKEIWRPSGLLLTHFVEHAAAVNRVAVAPDHAFFVTASDDGTCKIWDTSRLEKNVLARSRHTHRHAEGTKVKALCFVENTHTFLSGATDGSIQAVRVEIKSAEGVDGVRFSRPTLVRDWQIPQTSSDTGETAAEPGSDEKLFEYANWMFHYREANSRSILLVATNLCRILMVDMKTMDIIHVMHNPLHHGTPTTFCVDRKHHWMALGTSHGVIDLWDLRFRLRLRSFGIGGAGSGQRIDKLVLHPTRGHGKWVVASCGGEASIWDVEKLICREVLRPATFIYPSTLKIKNYEPWFPDEESSENMLKRFANEVDSKVIPNQLTQNQYDSSKTNATESEEKALAITAIRPDKPTAPSITSVLLFNDNVVNERQSDSSSKTAVMLSVGEDRTLRYWNLGQIDRSFIISGPMINVVGEENKTKPRYETSWPTSMSLSGLVQLVEEKLSDLNQEDSGSARSTPRKKKEAAKSSKPTKDDAKTTVSKMPRNTIISMAQEQLLRTHMDGIMDVALLRKPYGCIVTVDKGGSIFIFH